MIKFVIFSIFVVANIVPAFTGESRIVGGEEGDITEAPFLVSIRYKKNDTTPFEHRCSGTIYSSNVILTTATCVVGLETNRLHIKAGSTYRTQFDGVIYPVEKLLIHPDYNIWFFDNDLALLKLAIDLPADNPKQIATVPVLDHLPPAGKPAFVAGWGTTNPASTFEYSEVLNLADVYMVDRAKCRAAYGEGRITEAMICASGDGKDACTGDSGGPLVHHNRAVGLVSWGFNCANAEFPGVYTNLVVFKEWIETEVEKL